MQFLFSVLVEAEKVGNYQATAESMGEAVAVALQNELAWGLANGPSPVPDAYIRLAGIARCVPMAEIEPVEEVVEKNLFLDNFPRLKQAAQEAKGRLVERVKEIRAYRLKREQEVKEMVGRADRLAGLLADLLRPLCGFRVRFYLSEDSPGNVGAVRLGVGPTRMCGGRDGKVFASCQVELRLVGESEDHLIGFHVVAEADGATCLYYGSDGAVLPEQALEMATAHVYNRLHPAGGVVRVGEEETPY